MKYLRVPMKLASEEVAMKIEKFNELGIDTDLSDELDDFLNKIIEAGYEIV